MNGTPISATQFLDADFEVLALLVVRRGSSKPMLIRLPQAEHYRQVPGLRPVLSEIAGPMPLGPKVRRRRRQLGLTIEEAAHAAGWSKPYLSLFESEKTPNPPSAGKLRQLEEVLRFDDGELTTAADLARCPSSVRALLAELRGAGAAFSGEKT
jgi:hypothetical protein